MYDFLFRLFARLGCHQRSDRSFFFRGRQFPLCARCTGMFAGYALSLLLSAFVRPHWAICLALVLPMLIDVAAQNLFGRESTNARRFVTGLLAGYGLLTAYIIFAVWLVGVLFPTA